MSASKAGIGSSLVGIVHCVGVREEDRGKLSLFCELRQPCIVLDRVLGAGVVLGIPTAPNQYLSRYYIPGRELLVLPLSNTHVTACTGHVKEIHVDHLIRRHFCGCGI